MNRKWLLGIILVLTTTAIVIIAISKINNRYNKIIISDNVWEKIESTRSKSTGIKIENIKFDDYSLLIDEKTSTIYYSAVNTSKKYNPTVKVTGNKGKVSIASLEKMTDEKVASNHKFKIMIYNKENYRVYNMVVTSLPIINIRYTSDETTKIQMELSLFDNNVAAFRKNITSMGTLNIKENESEKDDYTFSLKSESLGRNTRENNLSLFGMEKHSEYVLNSMWEDDEKVRNVFTTNLWTELDNVKMDCFRYVELFINDEYKGLYSLGYNIEREALRLGPDEFLFYKKTLAPSENNVSNAARLEGYTLYDSQMEKVRNKDEIRPNCPPGEEDCEIVDAWEELRSFYETLESKDAEKIKSSINENNAIDLYLYYLFVQASNNLNEETFQNTYMIFRNSTSGYKVEYKPWNMNTAFGSCVKDGTPEADCYNASDNSFIMKYNPITTLIEMNDKEIIQKVKDEYNNLRNTKWTEEKLTEKLSGYETEMKSSGAYLRELEKYPEEKKFVTLNKTKEYVSSRLKAMDEYIQSL